MNKIFNTNDILKYLRDGTDPETIAKLAADAINDAMASYEREKQEAEAKIKAQQEAEALEKAKYAAAEKVATAINEFFTLILSPDVEQTKLTASDVLDTIAPIFDLVNSWNNIAATSTKPTKDKETTKCKSDDEIILNFLSNIFSD